MKSIPEMAAKAWENAEPIFMIRAQDKCSLPTIRAYIEKCQHLGADEAHIADIRRIEREFEQWQRANDTKIPD